MNAEAIMTPGGIATGFQGLVNAAMHLPLQYQQNRMQQNQQDMENTRLRMQLQEAQLANAFRNRQLDTEQAHWQAQQDMAQAHLGIAQDEAKMRSQEFAMRQEQDRRAAAAQALSQVEKYGLGAAEPVGQTSFESAFKNPGQMISTPALGGDAFKQYSPAQLGAANVHEQNMRKGEAEITQREALTGKAERWMPADNSARMIHADPDVSLAQKILGSSIMGKVKGTDPAAVMELAQQLRAHRTGQMAQDTQTAVPPTAAAPMTTTTPAPAAKPQPTETATHRKDPNGVWHTYNPTTKTWDPDK